jgi:hypothetical protein
MNDDRNAPADICGAVVVDVHIEGIPVRACTRMAVIDDTYQGALGTGMVKLETLLRINGQLRADTRYPPVTPADAAAFCSFDGRLSGGQETRFWVSFILDPPTPESALAYSCGP